MQDVDVPIPQVQDNLRSILSRYNLSEPDMKWIVDHYLTAELTGKSTHGLKKFCWDIQFYNDRISEPRITHEDQALAMIDGRREIGPLAARFCIDLVCRKVASHGVAIAGLKNFQRFGVLSSWSAEFANRGLIGFVTNSTEPAALPEDHSANSEKPALGTNPLSVGIPFGKAPLVLDMSTTKAPLSAIWASQESGKRLPERVFRDQSSNYTDDPFSAECVDIWGGVKGLNLSIMLQALSGPILGVATDKTWQDKYEVGALFVAFDPERLSGSFEISNSEIRRFVRMLEVSGIFPPGTNARRSRRNNLENGTIKVPLKTLRTLEGLISE